MRLYYLSPITSERNSLVLSELTDSQGHILTATNGDVHYSSLEKSLSCELFLDGLREDLIFNKDSVPLVKSPLMKQLQALELGNTTFLSIKNLAFKEYYAMIVGNRISRLEFEFLKRSKSETERIGTEIFEVIECPMPLVISENVLKLLQRAKIRNIECVETGI